MTTRERISCLSSPIARRLLSAVVDALETAVLDSIQNPRSEFARYCNSIGKNYQLQETDPEYLAQERELRILIYSQNVERTGNVWN